MFAIPRYHRIEHNQQMFTICDKWIRIRIYSFCYNSLTVAKFALTVYGGGGVPGGPVGVPGGVSYRGLTLPICPNIGSFVTGSVNIAACISFKLDGLERVLECCGGGK